MDEKKATSKPNSQPPEGALPRDGFVQILGMFRRSAARPPEECSLMNGDDGMRLTNEQCADLYEDVLMNAYDAAIGCAPDANAELLAALEGLLDAHTRVGAMISRTKALAAVRNTKPPVSPGRVGPPA